jgi:hypothetical protein
MKKQIPNILLATSASTELLGRFCFTVLLSCCLAAAFLYIYEELVLVGDVHESVVPYLKVL